MKNLKRLLLGVLSSLLLAAGFSHAADHLDPMSRGLQPRTDSTLAGAPDSTTICDEVDSIS